MPKLENNSAAIDLIELKYPFDGVLEIVRQAHEAAAQLTVPIRQMQEAFNSISATMQAMSAAAETYKRVFESVALLGLRNPYQGFIPRAFSTSTTIDGEIVEEPQQNTQTQSLPRTQALLPVAPTIKYWKVFEKFNMAMTIEGRFYYVDQLLLGISTNSKHGQLLKLLLLDEDNYVTDAFQQEKFDPPDPVSGLSYIRDDLKRYLGKDGLRIELYRNRDKTNKGIKLLKISRLSN